MRIPPSIAQPDCDCIGWNLEVEACREVWSAEEVTTVSARRQIASGLSESSCTDDALDPSFFVPLLTCLLEFAWDSDVPAEATTLRLACRGPPLLALA